ncbi:MAG: helix-turn-helix domain-containing protein [Caulobacter sp.]|nr:helix-turn-helix domain-containing protein [Caulobacter sp.]
MSSPRTPATPLAPVRAPLRFLRTQDAAKYLGLSFRTLEKHRTYGTGPAFRKLGGRVVYAIDDLDAWTDRGLKVSTRDALANPIAPAQPRAGA